MKSQNKTLERVRGIVKPQYMAKVNWPHGWPHVWGVEKASRDLSILENQDPVICGIVAYCHDLGRVVEEEARQVDRNLGGKKHAELGMVPTQEVLREVGISGLEYDLIVEAVKVHADFRYCGDNSVAKIIRDADKKDGLGPWGVLRTSNFVLQYDFQPPEREDVLGISRKALDLLERINKSVEDREKYLGCLEFNLEWYEDLLDTSSAEILLRPDYEYIKNVQRYMLGGND